MSRKAILIGNECACQLSSSLSALFRFPIVMTVVDMKGRAMHVLMRNTFQVISMAV